VFLQKRELKCSRFVRKLWGNRGAPRRSPWGPAHAAVPAGLVCDPTRRESRPEFSGQRHGAASPDRALARLLSPSQSRSAFRRKRRIQHGGAQRPINSHICVFTQPRPNCDICTGHDLSDMMTRLDRSGGAGQPPENANRVCEHAVRFTASYRPGTRRFKEAPRRGSSIGMAAIGDFRCPTHLASGKRKAGKPPSKWYGTA
jgi:hypothetical protein